MKVTAIVLGLALALGGTARAEGNTCRKLPPGKRVKVNLKPETEIGDLVSWISSITCKQFLFSGAIDSHKKVTIVAPQPMTGAEAYQLFLSALDSVGLTVVPNGTFLRLIETSAAKSSPVPVQIGR